MSFYPKDYIFIMGPVGSGLLFEAWTGKWLTSLQDLARFWGNGLSVFATIEDLSCQGWVEGVVVEESCWGNERNYKNFFPLCIEVWLPMTDSFKTL